MSRIYSATYSHVPVYEFNIAGNHVMRRRSDDWINATHILKVADFDKPARTRILEREVQKGTHEKVQGGYGKYQGTWVPLPEGRMLAERNGVLDRLLPIFDYVPGDRSPPPAPKHATAASSKPKAPRQPAQPRKAPCKNPTTTAKYIPVPTDQYVAVPQHQHRMSESFDNFSMQMNEDETPDNGTLASESDGEMGTNSQYAGSRKRRRGVEKPQQMSFDDQQHLLWSDELLDYFMLQHSVDPPSSAPEPPPGVDINRAVDDKGHTPMHWAAAMGDLNIVQDLIRRGARIDTLASNGETPLMRAVMFTNNWAQQTMELLIGILHSTVGGKDWFGSTVFHQITMMTCSKSKYSCARYYVEAILACLDEFYVGDQIKLLLDQQDHNGDTAILIAARFGARKCVRILMEHGADAEIPNVNGEVADDLIRELNVRRRDRHRPSSSSPALPGPIGTQVADLTEPSSHSLVAHPLAAYPLAPHLAKAMPPTYRSEAAAMLASQLPSLISSRTEALAAAMEASLVEKDQELREVQRLVVQRRASLEALQEKTRLLTAKLDEEAYNFDKNDPNALDEHQKRELESLCREYEAQLTAKYDADIHRHMQEWRSKRTPEELRPQHPEDPNEKLHLTRQLLEVQAKRATLIKAIVEATANQGNPHKISQYKRLIAAGLGIKSEDVEGLLPDILRELEEGRPDVGAPGDDDNDDDQNGGLDGSGGELQRLMMMGASGQSSQHGLSQGHMGFGSAGQSEGTMYAPLGPPADVGAGNEARTDG